MDAPRFFEEEWREIALRLRRAVYRAGVPADECEDVVQETALRLFRSWGSVDQERSIEAYARVIALNVWRDRLRTGPSRVVVGQVPDQAAVDADVERIGLARLEVRSVGLALRELPPGERQLLLAPLLGPSRGAPLADALRMARMRARRHLRALLERAGAVAAFVPQAWHWVPSARTTVVTATVTAALVSPMPDRLRDRPPYGLPRRTPQVQVTQPPGRPAAPPAPRRIGTTPGPTVVTAPAVVGGATSRPAVHRRPGGPAPAPPAAPAGSDPPDSDAPVQVELTVDLDSLWDTLGG